jgi:hypothetical protein
VSVSLLRSILCLPFHLLAPLSLAVRPAIVYVVLQLFLIPKAPQHVLLLLQLLVAVLLLLVSVVVPITLSGLLDSKFMQV